MVRCGSRAIRTNTISTPANAAVAVTRTGPVRVRATDQVRRTATHVKAKKAIMSGMPPVHTSHRCPLSM